MFRSNSFPPNTLSRLAVVVALSLGAAACGSDSEPVTASDPGATEAPAPETTDVPSEDPIPVEPDGGIGDTPLGQIPFFGANDDQCQSTILRNESTDQDKVTVGAECFLAELEAGNPVVWDLNQPTVEGDPIFIRHFFDGESIWILTDDRADEFGSGRTTSQRCESAELSNWGVAGASCVIDDSSGFAGFPEAES